MVVHHILRRAIGSVPAPTGPDDERVQVPFVGGLIFTLTCFAFFLLLAAISYTYGHVITTLCMIESPETSAYVPVNNIAADEPPAYSEGQDDAAPTGMADEVNLVRNKPFTSSLRATILHLRARAGYWSRFRGLGLFLVLGFIRSILVALLSFGTANPIILAVAVVAAETILANLHMTWIHVVISEPSKKSWRRRLPSPAFQSWRRIAPAVALWGVTTQVTYLLPMLVIGAGAGRYADPSYQPGRKEMYLTMGQAFGAMLLTVTLFILLEIPAMVTMTRVAASMLPEEDETIVPFDRSYGNKVTPSILGGEGKIGLLEAWKSFPWASRKRLVFLCAKVAGIIMAIWVLFTFVIAIEAHAFFGPKAFGQLLKSIRSGR